MEYVDLQYRIIQLYNENKYSFQFYNPSNNRIFFTSEEWWKTPAEAEQEALRIKGKVLDKLKEFGIPTGAPFSGGVGGSSPQASGAIIVALAIHKDTGKYGYVVMRPDGEILIKPKEYLDTPGEVLALVKKDEKQILDELKKLGINGLQFVVAEDDFKAQPNELQKEFARQEIATPILPYDIPHLPKEEASTPIVKPLLRPSHFDPFMN